MVVSRRYASPGLKGEVQKSSDTEVRVEGRWLAEVSQKKEATYIKKER